MLPGTPGVVTLAPAEAAPPPLAVTARIAIRYVVASARPLMVSGLTVDPADVHVPLLFSSYS